MGLIVFSILIEFSKAFCLVSIVSTEIKTLQYANTNINSLCVLIITANIIHLKLNTDDKAIISINLFLFNWVILPTTALIKILTKTAVFIINMRM
jgi:hypothetical protein